MPTDHRDNPVVLSQIYTRTGDDGTTALSDGSRARKTDSRLAAYADTEEANCAIGVAITLGGLPSVMATLLARIQNELFDVGADLANPVSDEPRAYPPIRVDESYIAGWSGPAMSTTRTCRLCAASSSLAGRQARRCCTPRAP